MNLEYEVTQTLKNVELSVDVFTGDGTRVTTSCQSDYIPEVLEKREIGIYQVSVKFPGMFFMPGPFMLTVVAHEPMVEILDIHEKVLRFNIIDTGTKFSKYNPDHSIGVIMAELPWQQLTTVS